MDDVTFVCIEKQRFETLVKKELLLDTVYEAMKPFLADEFFDTMAKENGFADDEGNVVDEHGFYAFLHGWIASVEKSYKDIVLSPNHCP
jgi:hypothetical protein